jgi:hypothetical protein
MDWSYSAFVEHEGVQDLSIRETDVFEVLDQGRGDILSLISMFIL